MSTLSQFSGGGGVPVGGYITAIDAPINFTQNGQEFLRAGYLKPYTSDYADTIAKAPQLRVFGNDARTYGNTVGSSQWKYYYVGTRYVALADITQAKYGSSLSSMGSDVGSLNINYSVNKRVAVGGGYMVAVRDDANVPFWWTNDGTAVSAVGGSFATCPVKTAICYGNNSWLALSSLGGTAFEQAYINSANPSGFWTVGASTVFANSNPITAISYGNGVFVAVSSSTASNNAQKIFTCPSVGSAWMDRTGASGLYIPSAETINDVVFDGTVHVAVTNYGRIITSPDGITWTNRGKALDDSFLTGNFSSVNYPYGTINPNLELCTDGSGTVVVSSYSASYNSTGSRRVVHAVSTDHCVTFTSWQTYIGKAPQAGSATVASISYANGKWIANHSGASQSVVEIGSSFTTPDYIGAQYDVAIGAFVRIK